MVYDVVVVGGGGAGLSAAISAKESGAKIAVVSKTYPTKSQTSMAQGGINAPLNEKDTSSHINDTLKFSSFLANQKMVERLINSANDTIGWLNQIGVVFSRNEDGKIAQRRLGGASCKRACYAQDYTGLKILHSLFDEANKQEIEFFNEYMLLDILVQNNQVVGVKTLDIKTSKIVTIRAKSVILATGGYLSIYNNFTTNSTSNTGDGVAIAKKAGAKLSSMEFIQFHPTALKNSKILISESARGEGGYLINQKNERFVDELSTRDEISRAIYREILNGNEVFLDIRHLGEEFIEENLPQERKLALHYERVDPVKDLIPISPAAHYCMGGIDVDKNHQTSIKNLFAVGECANSKAHGANRLGGNSLLEIISFGREVGKRAFEVSKEALIKDIKEIEDDFIEELFKKTPTKNFYEAKKRVGEEFFNKCGIFREKKSLTELLEYILKLQKEINQMGIVDKSRNFNTNLVEFLEFINTLEVAKVVVKSALNRKESRGGHYRVDYPTINKDYEKHIEYQGE